ncbi:MAG: efflux RND transporter periplasmic adaptor subunit [Lachnospiraceae bacterium]
MRRLSGKFRSGMALAVCTAFVMTGCGNAVEEAATEEAVLVTSQIASAGDLTLTSSFIGTISPEETVSVYPLASGLITDTYFEVGDVVNAGDVLFQIDDEVATIQAETARLSAEQAELSAESTLGTQQDSLNIQLEQAAMSAQSSYEQAQIAYVQAKDAYDDYDDKIDAAESAKNGANEAVVAAKADMEAKETAYIAYKEGYDDERSGGTEPSNPTYTGDGLNAAKAAYEAAKSTYMSAQISAASAQATYESIKDGKESVRMAFYQAQSAYKSADQNRTLTEESANLTQGDVYEDTAAQLQVGIDMANLSADSAALALSYYTVKAPVSGVIESKNVEVNGMASSGMPAYTIVNNNTMTVSYYVSEKIKNTCQLGQEIQLERNGKTYNASITEIGSSVDPQAGLFKIKACVAATGDELPSGVTVKITADTYSAQNAVVIPYDAVYYDNSGAYVYLNQENRAVKRYVVTGIFDDDNMVIEEGIDVGDEIVTSWSPQLTSGALLSTTITPADGASVESGNPGASDGSENAGDADEAQGADSAEVAQTSETEE